MLERLHFILGVVWVKVYPRQQPNYSAEGESLKEEGALAVVICALGDAPSKVAQEVHPVLI